MLRALISRPGRIWLLACLACACTFILGLSAPVGVHYSNSRLTFEVVSERGRLWLGYYRRPSGTWALTFERGFGLHSWDYLFRAGGAAWSRRAGFGYSVGPGRRIVLVPYWFVGIALLATLPSTMIIARGRLARSSPDRICVRCGYDLRASTGRCPECGNSILHGPGAAPRPIPNRRLASWSILAGAIAGLATLLDLYFRERRIDFPTTASTLQTALALAAVATGVLALGRALEPPDRVRGKDSANSIAAVGIALGLATCLVVLFVPRLIR